MCGQGLPGDASAAGSRLFGGHSGHLEVVWLLERGRVWSDWDVTITGRRILHHESSGERKEARHATLDRTHLLKLEQLLEQKPTEAQL